MQFTPQQKLQILREIENNASLAYMGAIKMVNEKLSETHDKKIKDLQDEFEKVVDDMEQKLEQAHNEKMKELQDKFKKVVDDMKEKVSIMKPKDGEPGEKGDDGDDYVLTSEDKIEIASNIKVPIVEKVIIEKTETVVEKPIIKEIAINEKPIEIATKLNTLNEVIDVGVIKGLEKRLVGLFTAIREKRGGGGSGGGGGMGNVVPESFGISSATTTITLTNSVASNGRAIWFNYQGQQQAYGTHFTVSGKIITLLFTPQDSTYADIIYIRK